MRIKTRTFTLYKNEIRRFENIVKRLPSEIDGHQSKWAALYCLGLTFTDDIKRFLEYLETTNQFDLLHLYSQESLF